MVSGDPMLTSCAAKDSCVADSETAAQMLFWRLSVTDALQNDVS